MKILLVAFSLSMLLAGTAHASDWIKLRETNTGTAYYDRDSVAKSGRRVTIEVKFVYTPDGVKEFREAFTEIPSTEKISYTLYVYEIDCTKEAFRILSAATYNTSELAIRGTKLERTDTGPEMEHITPKSILESLFYFTCPGPK